MNRFFTALLAVTAALSLSITAHAADAAFQANARDIPKTLPHIPEAYAQSASQQGQLVQLDYDTWEAFSISKLTGRR